MTDRKPREEKGRVDLRARGSWSALAVTSGMEEARGRSASTSPWVTARSPARPRLEAGARSPSRAWPLVASFPRQRPTFGDCPLLDAWTPQPAPALAQGRRQHTGGRPPVQHPRGSACLPLPLGRPKGMPWNEQTHFHASRVTTADPLLQTGDGTQQEGRQVQPTAHTPTTPGEPCCLHRSEDSLITGLLSAEVRHLPAVSLGARPSAPAQRTLGAAATLKPRATGQPWSLASSTPSFQTSQRLCWGGGASHTAKGVSPGRADWMGQVRRLELHFPNC